MEELKRRAAALDEKVGRLDDDVVKYTDAVVRLTDRMDRSDRDRKWFVVAILVVAMFVAAVGLVAFRSEQNIRRAAAERNELWCPVFGLIVGGYREDQAETRPGYRESHRLMRHGYEVLGCTAPLVAPSTGTGPR